MMNPSDNFRLFQEEKKRPEVNIDMNPMVDLAFLLLTFFMLTTTFSRPQAMELVMPVKEKPGEENKVQPVKESKTFTLYLNEQDQIHWLKGISNPQHGSLSYGPKELRRFLMEQKSNIPGLVILIKPMPNSRYEHIVDVLDEMNIVGIERFAVMDYEPEDEALLQSLSLISSQWR